MRRLRHRPQFQALLRTPPLARTQHFALHGLYVAAPDDAATGSAESFSALFAPAGMTWLGAMTPKRSARRAVTRNAIRRQVYALGPQVNLPAEGMAYLVRLRAPYAREQFPSACSNALRHAVRTELTQLFERGRDKPCAPH